MEAGVLELWLDYPSLLLPTADNLLVLLAVLGVAAACSGLGVWAGARRPSHALVAGWGVVGCVTVVVGTLTPIPLHWVLAVLALVGIAGLARGVRIGFDAGALAFEARVLALLVPLLLLVAGMEPTQFDEFSHWLPNVAHLVLHDRFPTAEVPNLFSHWPAYPYGLPLVGYSVSLLVGRLAESAGIVWNVLLLAAAGATLARMVALRDVVDGPTSAPKRSLGWAMAALAALVGGLAAPGFVAKLAFTNYTNSASAVVIAVVCALAIEGIFGPPERRRAALAASGWAAAALVNLRQDTLVLFVLLLVGLAMAVMLAKRQVVRDLRLGHALVLAPPFLTTLLWRLHCAAEMPAGSFSFLPLADWRWDTLPQTLLAIFGIMLNKGGFFLPALLVVLAALVGLARASVLTPFQRVAAIAGAAVFLGNTAFLAFAYLAANFTDQESIRAASFWRYSTHAGQIVTLAVMALVPLAWYRAASASRAAAIGLVGVTLALPLVTAYHLRFDLRTDTAHLRQTGRMIAAAVPQGLPIVLVDAQGDGSVTNQVRFEVWLERLRADPSQPPMVMPVYAVADAASIPAVRDARYLWIFEATPRSVGVTNLPLEPDTSYLVERAPGGDLVLFARGLPTPILPAARP
jgi:hypothetical protein